MDGQSQPPLGAKERTLADLYADIPRVPCKPGCRDCCGVIPMASKEEADAFAPAVVMVDEVRKANGEFAGNRYVIPMETTGKCRKATKEDEKRGCLIHDKRPFMCRLFGTVAAKDVPYNDPAVHLICPHGRKPDKPLTPMQARSLMAEYFAICARTEKPAAKTPE